MAEENTLKLAHQNGPQTLRLEKGGYSLENGRLAISLETENIDPEGWPPVALFCIYNYPMDRKLRVGDVFECEGGMDAEDAEDEEAAHAAAYFSFHAVEVYVKFTVVESRKGAILFDFEAKHDDTDYYDDRAAKCLTAGTFLLAPKPAKDLWIPI